MSEELTLTHDIYALTDQYEVDGQVKQRQVKVGRILSDSSGNVRMAFFDSLPVSQEWSGACSLIPRRRAGGSRPGVGKGRRDYYRKQNENQDEDQTPEVDADPGWL